MYTESARIHMLSQISKNLTGAAIQHPFFRFFLVRFRIDDAMTPADSAEHQKQGRGGI